MSRFAAIKSDRSRAIAVAPEASPVAEADVGAGKTMARAGKKAISGYFSPEVSRALHMLALENGSSLQALMGEAFDDLMRKYGRHPFGER